MILLWKCQYCGRINPLAFMDCFGCTSPIPDDIEMWDEIARAVHDAEKMGDSIYTDFRTMKPLDKAEIKQPYYMDGGVSAPLDELNWKININEHHYFDQEAFMEKMKDALKGC